MKTKMNRTQHNLNLAALLVAVAIALTGHLALAFVLLLAVGTISGVGYKPGHCYNSLGTVAATQILVMEALSLIYTKRPLLRNISTGFTDKDTGSPFAVLNQAVVTRLLLVPTPIAFADTDTSDVTPDVSVTLGSHTQVRYAFAPTDYSATNRDLIREAVAPLTIAVGNAMVDAIAAVWTPGNYPTRTAALGGADAIANGATVTKTVLGAGWDYTHLTSIGGILDKAGVPDWKRFYACNSDVWSSFQNDPRIVGYFWNQNNGQAITEGYLPRVNGFDIAKYPALTGKAGNNLVAFAGSPDATVYAARAMRDPREMPGFADVPFPGVMTTVTENIIKTGLTLNMEMWIAPTTLNAYIRLHWLHGEGAGATNDGQLICSQ